MLLLLLTWCGLCNNRFKVHAAFICVHAHCTYWLTYQLGRWYCLDFIWACELTVNSSCILATLSHDCDIKHTCGCWHIIYDCQLTDLSKSQKLQGISYRLQQLSSVRDLSWICIISRRDLFARPPAAADLAIFYHSIVYILWSSVPCKHVFSGKCPGYPYSHVWQTPKQNLHTTEHMH